MKLKPGVDVLGIKPELLLGLQVAEAVYARHRVELVVTSVTDGQHRRGSLHYQGLAADLRVHGLPAERSVREGVAREIGEGQLGGGGRGPEAPLADGGAVGGNIGEQQARRRRPRVARGGAEPARCLPSRRRRDPPRSHRRRRPRPLRHPRRARPHRRPGRRARHRRTRQQRD